MAASEYTPSILLPGSLLDMGIAESADRAQYVLLTHGNFFVTVTLIGVLNTDTMSGILTIYPLLQGAHHVR